MGVDLILTRLERVKRNGAGWRADCPVGHSHARGSLSLSEADDGRILLHCFACGNAADPLRALGLELADLFPERIKDPSPQARKEAHEAFKRTSWRAALGVLVRESGVVLIAARDLRAADVFAGEDADRLALAVDRIEGVREVLA